MSAVAKCLGALRRKLERAELEHLRNHAAELAARVEQLEFQCQDAERSAALWQESYLQVEEALHSEAGATHRAIGVNKSGEMMVVRLDA